MSELQKIIKSKYDNDWIALSNEDKIFQLTNLVSSQKNHYGFKPQGLWLGLGDNWLRYIKDNDMTDWITEYCSAFSIKLGSNILELKDKEDYVNFTKRYSETPFKIKWEVVAKKYDGIIAYAPRRFAFDNSLSWTYGWDITSACIWNDNGIENVDLIFNGCNDENFETFRDGGKIHYSCVLINQKEVLGTFGQVHENLYSHHSTIEYKPTDIKGLEIGKKIDLKITGRLTNDKVDVLLVDNPYSKNKYPHITLSTAKGVKPVASNFEIENNLDDVIPLDGVLKGVITVCRFEQGGEIEGFKKGGNVVTWKHKYNKKYGYPKNESHSLKEISKDTGVSMKGLRQIYNKGIGAYKTNPSSVRPNVTSKEQWAMARVYSSVMGGKASKVDAKELKMEKGGILNNPNFKSWFGDSKVVDENGNPLVVYHSTNKDFDEFKAKGMSSAFFFSENKEVDMFPLFGNKEKPHSYNSSIMPVYLKLKNPKFLYDLSYDPYFENFEIDSAKKKGNDGVIIERDNQKTYVVFEPTQIKSAIGNIGDFDPNNPSIIMAEGGEVCTYDFDGYDLAKMKCGNEVDVYLVPAEYDRVSIYLFENHFPLWLYYNYLARIVASPTDVEIFKEQCLNVFDINREVELTIKQSDDKKFWKTQPFGQARSYMGYIQNQSDYKIKTLKIVLVANGYWAKQMRERTSKLTLPHPKGVLLNTVIHEFSHLIDVIRFNKENPTEKVIVTHQRGFRTALKDVLIACKTKEIEIVSQIDNKALIIQRALKNPRFVEQYKDQFGINVFEGFVPKDLKEYDNRFIDLKGSKINKDEANDFIDLIQQYQDEELTEMVVLNPKKANKLYKQTNELLDLLVKHP